MDILKNNRNYRLIAISNFINRLGDAAETIAFTYLLYLFTGSASISALGLCINLIPTVFIQPLIGILIEHRNYKRIIIYADLVRGLCVLILVIKEIYGVLYYTDLLLINFVCSLIECFRVPAGIAIIPDVCDEEEYSKQSSVNSIVNTTSAIFGALVGGIILAHLSVAGIYILDSITFGVSGIILCFVKIRNVKKPEITNRVDGKLIIRRFQMFFSSKTVLLLILVSFFNNILALPYIALEAPIINDMLGGSSILLSISSVAGTMGIIVGSVLFFKIEQRAGNKKIIVLALLSYAPFYFMLIYLSQKEYIMIKIGVAMLSFLNSMITVWLSISVQTNFLKTTDADELSWKGAFFNSIISLCMPIGSLILSGIASGVSVEVILGGAGIMSVLFAIAIGFRSDILDCRTST